MMLRQYNHYIEMFRTVSQQKSTEVSLKIATWNFQRDHLRRKTYAPPTSSEIARLIAKVNKAGAQRSIRVYLRLGGVRDIDTQCCVRTFPLCIFLF